MGRWLHESRQDAARSQVVLGGGNRSRNGEVDQTGPGYQLDLGSEWLRGSGRPWLPGFPLLVLKMEIMGEGVLV